MQRIKLPQIQGYYLTLTLKDPILTLDIEEESSGAISSLDINEDSVYEVTNGFFETLQDLSQGLKSAANRSCPGIVLTLSKEQLTYMGACSLGAAQMELSFTLKLREKRVEQVEVIEKQCKVRHEVEIQKYQQNLLLFQKENEKIARKLKELEELNKSLQASIISKPEFSFNQDSVYASKFTLTNDNKTATATADTYPCLEILPQIPSSGLYCFSFKINKTAQNWICFGIIAETGVGWAGNPFHYRYWMFDGRIYGKASQQPTGDGPFGGKDSIIKMVVDIDQGTLTFFADGTRVNYCKIFKAEKYFAYISLGNVGDSVTLL